MPMKRKRRSKKEKEKACDFCQGVENRNGEQEGMLSCVDCGGTGAYLASKLSTLVACTDLFPIDCLLLLIVALRSLAAHPSCMPPLRYLSVEAQLSKPWKCAVCKSCEICGGKENDVRL